MMSTKIKTDCDTFMKAEVFLMFIFALLNMKGWKLKKIKKNYFVILYFVDKGIESFEQNQIF